MRGRGRDRALARRFKNARRLAIELAALENYLAQNLFSWMRADTYAPPVDGKITAFLDRVAPGVGARAVDNNHMFAQLTAANQVVVPTVSANFNGRDAASFAGSQYYDSTITPASWAFLHDGSGFSSWNVVRRTGGGFLALWSSARFTVGFPGAENLAGSSGEGALTVVNAAGSFPIQASGNLANGMPVNTTCVFHSRYRTADTPDFAVTRSGGLGVTGNQSTAPSSAAPEASLRIGARAVTSAFGWVGQISDCMFVNSTDFALRALVERYYLLRYGLPA